MKHASGTAEPWIAADKEPSLGVYGVFAQTLAPFHATALQLAKP